MKKVTSLPVVLRPYPAELLYSWLARMAAVYGISIGQLLSFSAAPWDLCVMPSVALVATLSEMTRLPPDAIQQLTISGSGVAQPWWNIRQIAPDVFSPDAEYEYAPSLKFCRLCLWDDVAADRDEFIRREWMLAVPTICLVHGTPMEDTCGTCQSSQFPIFATSRRGFRLLCQDCKRPLAKREFLGKQGFIPEVKTLQAFESALFRALKKQLSMQFPAALAGPRSFLQAVEDLLALLLTRQTEGFQHFVNCLHPTVVRVPQRLNRPHKSRPWLGEFPVRIRRGLLSHVAALLGGTAVRHRLLTFPSTRYVFAELLEELSTVDAKGFTRRLAFWPPLLKRLAFEPHYTH